MLRILTVALLVASVPTYAQKKELITGKPFPYSGTFLVNNENQNKTIDSYKGKYLLLDLFGSSCIQCFQNMPILDSINKMHKDNLSILLIGLKDNKLEVLYEKFRKRFNLQLDMAIDSAIFKKVKYAFLPTYVWIGPDGLVRAVSGPDKVTVSNIERFITGQPLSFDTLPVIQTFSPKKDYLSGGNGGPDSNYLIRSILGKWNPTLPYISPEGLRFAKDTKKFTALGKTMAGLYRYAYFNSHFWRYGDRLNGKAWLEPVLPDEDTPSQDEERYCYSASYKTEQEPDLVRLLKNALEQYFGYTGSIVQQRMPYYSVSVLPARREQLKTKGEKQIRRRTHALMDYRNVSLDQVIERIAYYNTSKIPFLNESDILFNVDVTFEAILTEESDFFAALQQIGIVIEKKYRLMDVLVLSKIKKSVAVQ